MIALDHIGVTGRWLRGLSSTWTSITILSHILWLRIGLGLSLVFGSWCEGCERIRRSALLVRELIVWLAANSAIALLLLSPPLTR